MLAWEYSQNLKGAHRHNYSIYNIFVSSSPTKAWKLRSLHMQDHLLTKTPYKEGNCVLLNHAHAGHRLVCACFPEIISSTNVVMCVCMSVCLSFRALITRGMIWCDIDQGWLVKQDLQLVSTIQLLYMILAINKLDECGLSNTAHCECPPRRLR